MVRKAKADYDAVLNTYDVLIMPTIPFGSRRQPPPNAGPLASVNQTAGIVVNTAQFNGTGHPALSVPIGWTRPVEADILAPEDKDIKLPLQTPHALSKHPIDSLVEGGMRNTEYLTFVRKRIRRPVRLGFVCCSQDIRRCDFRDRS